MRALVLICVVASAGCLRQTEYRCSDGASSCGAGGQCESNGFCSVPDGECSSGRRYHDAAGAMANKCVDGTTPMDDAAVTLIDSPTTDGTPMDVVSAGCPSGYAVLAGGQSGHLYMMLGADDDWAAQHAACRATTASAYLAIPDDIAELQALDTAAGATAIYWVGINDIDTEMQWRTVLDAAQLFLPWLAPAPDNQNPGEHCVAAIAATHNFNDDRCNTNMPAICECVP